MFTKEEAKQLRIDFWAGLNASLDKRRGYHGNKVDWMNFNTSIRHLYFRMEADEVGARLCIDLQFPNDGIREIFYEQFLEFKERLDKEFDQNLNWVPNFEHSNGKTVSRIYTEKKEVSLFNRNDWEGMHLFLESSFVKLEHFWAEFGEVFKNLS